MPYIHKDCGGRIPILTRKCKKCGYKWPKEVLLMTRPPEDMEFVTSFGTKVPKLEGNTTYSGWAKGTPAGLFASRLPNWPRWVRIVCLLVIVTLILFFIGRLGGCILGTIF